MHLLVTQSRTIEEADAAVDLGQTPGDVVILSYSDSDLGALASAAEAAPPPFSLRLASLAQLKHPYSVDLYAERVVAKARFVLVRLLGGLDYWRYGVEEFSRIARASGTTLAIVPGCDREDARLDDASTLREPELRRLWAYFRHGGAANMQSLYGWIAAYLEGDGSCALPSPLRGGVGGGGQAVLHFRGDTHTTTPTPCPSPQGGGDAHGWFEPQPLPPAGRYEDACRESEQAAGRVLITFYRAMVLAGDCAPIVALADVLAAQGLAVTALYVTSLKDPAAAAVAAGAIAAEKPDVVVNTTAFSARGDDSASVLDAADAPVLQAILAGAGEDQWRANPRGLGPADLAMNVVLPEMDGRIVTAAISCKAESPRNATLEFARLVHQPIPARVAFVADLAAAWVRLRRTPRAERRVAMVLSDYPGKLGREAYAVGLDTPASVAAIAEDLREAGYAIDPLPPADELMRTLAAATPSPARERRACPGLDPGWPSRQRGSDEGTRRFDQPDPQRPGPSSDPTSSGHPGSSPGQALLPHAREGRVAVLSLADYRDLLANLPRTFVEMLLAHWGDPSDDPALVDDAFPIRVLRAGNLTIALQPDRGRRDSRKADYHDTALPPCHAYVAFYLWLRHRAGIHALIHCGTHGTLEWLPGKPVALDETCAPEALLGPTPLIYPFIVNNPGEAAQAKRRNGAVTIGHLTPPLVDAGSHGASLELETLFDEYAAAETLDPKRARIIGRTLVERAAETGLATESGVDLAQGQSALVALDAWLCDVKEMRIRDGLHIFGRASSPATRGRGTMRSMVEGATAAAINAIDTSKTLDIGARRPPPPPTAVPLPGFTGEDIAAAESRGLLAALDGRFVPAGPAGAPSRGRTDVLPTGRNLYGTDPRAVPSRTAYEIGRRAAQAVAERYAQDHGDWPRRLVLDLWASATMRTGGEDFAQAMAHLGVRPQWDVASARVTGFEILPFASLERPRVDVTLRISGLFRDVFPAQITLFDQILRAVAGLDEDGDINPLAAARRAGESQPLRIFGAAPAAYGIGLGGRIDDDPMISRETLGRAYLAAGSHAYAGVKAEGAPSAAFADRVAEADAFVHVQDMVDLDVLDAQASVEAEAGFAAAAHTLGRMPALYHVDAGRADKLQVRTQTEEIARVVRGRAGNPRWIAGQMRHGHRGAAEIAETVDNLYAMAVMSDAVTSRQFDLVFAATCAEPSVRAFLLHANPDAARAIAERFRDAALRNLWTSRRNSDAVTLADMLDAVA